MNKIIKKREVNGIIITDLDLEYLEVKDKIPFTIEQKKEEYIKNKTNLYSLDILSNISFSDLNKIKFFGLLFKKINTKFKNTNFKYSYFYNKEDDTLSISLYHNYVLVDKCIIKNITQYSSPVQLFTIIIFISKNKIPLNLIKKI